MNDHISKGYPKGTLFQPTMPWIVKEETTLCIFETMTEINLSISQYIATSVINIEFLPTVQDFSREFMTK